MPTDESLRSDDPLRSRRRPLMKVLGAGAALSMAGGTAVAQQDDEPVDEPDDDSGVEGDSDGEETDGTNAAHTVETLIRGPPTNPERPADFFFQPTGLHVQPGDVVKFVFRTPDHNVVSYHPAFGMQRRVPTGVTAFSSPLLGWRPESIPGDQIEPPAEMGPPEESATGADGDGADETDEETNEAPGGGDESAGGPVPDTWLYAFETPGVYDLLCSPHEGFGMAMRVVVGDVTEAPFETSDPEALPEPRAGPVELARTTLTDPALDPDAIVSEGTVEWDALEANGGGGDGENGAEEEDEENGEDAEAENGESDGEATGENGAADENGDL
ncbi:plastocyanin/azurin family copper-binding protein [Halobellus sp. GM3]|uniref:plastocyanin/azurin family copper-binding protein n=1 Tax=Halobellus sp. GM3 TaxID=3458410 RepID=UPI00403DB015